MRAVRAGVVLAAVALAGCDQRTYDDAAIASEFAMSVAPILQQDCGTSACHAASDEKYPNVSAAYFAFPVDAQGELVGQGRLAEALLRSKAKLSGAGGRFAELVRKPLDESLGGTQHRGGTQYRSVRDPSFQKLLAWAEKARPTTEPELTPLQRNFSETVQPVLVRNRCFQSNCHGTGAANTVILDPGVEGEFDHHATIHNYELIVPHINVESDDPLLSRLIRKTIPQAQGGIFHRGGNTFFDTQTGDADLQALVRFVEEVRREVGADGTGAVTGLVFAATDPTPRRLFDIAKWQPGGDLYSLVPANAGGTLANLTQAHHTGPADVRDPSVSYDGKRVAFAMRTSQADCLNLYLMNIDGTGLTQVTRDTGTLPNGIKVSNVEPLWGPDDRLYFISTRAGVLAESRWPQSSLHRVNADGSGLVRLSHIPDNEVAPYWRFGHAHGSAPENRTLDLVFTAMRGVGNRRHGPLMRVPPDFRADYHPHYGTQSPTYQVFTQGTRFLDDREALILMDEQNVWEGGALALIDRNLGPVIADNGDSAIVNYVDSLQVLGTVGEEVAHRGYSKSGYYRDPVALPDGRIVVSHAGAPITLSDPLASPDPALVRITLRELAPNRTTIADREVLVDIPGKVEMDPEPIVVRRREEVGQPGKWLSYGTDTGELLNFDLAVSLTIGLQDSPSNTKPFEQVAWNNKFVRIVEEVPLEPGDFPNWPDTSTNSVGRGNHGLRRVLGEMPALSDRSFFVTLPAATPFYLQSLDYSRMAMASFNQWLFLQPGERLKQVTPRYTYDKRCGACHGAIGGNAGDTVGRPDVVSQASRVAANYDHQLDVDLPPTPVGIDIADRLEVDFELDVQPVLTRTCATSGCHVGGGRAPNLAARSGSAGFSGAYEALTASGTASKSGFLYVDPTSAEARTSYLAEVLSAKELDAPRTFDSQGCGGPARLTLMEMETLMRWMDLGASYRGVGPRTRPTIPELNP